MESWRRREFLNVGSSLLCLMGVTGPFHLYRFTVNEGPWKSRPVQKRRGRLGPLYVWRNDRTRGIRWEKGERRVLEPIKPNSC